MIRILLLLFIFFLCTSLLEAQNSDPEKKEIILPELKMKDKTFIEYIDSLIIGNHHIEEYRKNFVYVINIKKDVTCPYIVNISFIPLDIADKPSNIGYFFIKDKLFFLRGDNIEKLYKKKKEQKVFPYYNRKMIINGKVMPLSISEQYAKWKFCFSPSRLILLETSNVLPIED